MSASVSYLPNSIFDNIITMLGSAVTVSADGGFPTIECTKIILTHLEFVLADVHVFLNVQLGAFTGKQIGNTGRCPILVRKVEDTAGGRHIP